jgi:hypothetical protein
MVYCFVNFVEGFLLKFKEASLSFMMDTACLIAMEFVHFFIWFFIFIFLMLCGRSIWYAGYKPSCQASWVVGSPEKQPNCSEGSNFSTCLHELWLGSSQNTYKGYD